MNDFNLEDFTFGEELKRVIDSQKETAEKVIANSFDNDPFGMEIEKVDEIVLEEEDPFTQNKCNEYVEEGQNLDTECDEFSFDNMPIYLGNDIDTTNDTSLENTMNMEEMNIIDLSDNPFETMDEPTFEETNSSAGLGEMEYFGQDKYINAMHAFVDYMPINLSVDRDIPSYFESIVDSNSDLPTIVIEKMPNRMIALIHNLRKRPLPAIPTENRQPIVSWNGSIQEFMNKLEESVTFTHGFDEEEFKAMKKVIVVENMNDKTDLDQNEIYVTRQSVVDSLLNKYNSIIDLTNENCSINFKDNGKKYSLSIGGLGFNSNANREWAEEIRSKIVFMKNNEILLTGIAASYKVVSILKDTYGFNIVNETNEIKSLAAEI